MITFSPKYQFLKDRFSHFDARILDIGCGKDSPAKTMELLPNCTYRGVDLHAVEAPYGSDGRFEFRHMDLENTSYWTTIGRKGQKYDCILLSHVLEHLDTGVGYRLIEYLCENLLAGGGMVYIEYPNASSTQLPKMKGTLNFYDDPTHKTIMLYEAILSSIPDGVFTVSRGTRRHWPSILFLPIRLLIRTFNGKPKANLFWDLFGFADYCILIKLYDATRQSRHALTGGDPQSY